MMASSKEQLVPVEQCKNCFTPEAIERANAHVANLQTNLDITNADHIALWLEEHLTDDTGLGWLACRIVEAHEAALRTPPASSIALETIARTVEGWMEWHKTHRAAENLTTDEDTAIMAVPVPHWPTHGQLENWLKALRSTPPAVKPLHSMSLLERCHEELRLIRAKDTGAVYDIGLRSDLNAALAAPAAPAVEPDEGLVEKVAEVMAEDGGCWSACSGCQESVDGSVSTRDYPYSHIFKCQPGGGCHECGGIGVIWMDGKFLAGYGEALDPSIRAQTIDDDLKPIGYISWLAGLQLDATDPEAITATDITDFDREAGFMSTPIYVKRSALKGGQGV